MTSQPLLPLRSVVERAETRALLVMLLLTDVLFMGAHVLHVSDVSDLLGDPDFALNRDRGFGELYGYLKMLWATMLLALAARRHRSMLLLALAGATGGLLLDDALFLHERAGAVIGDRLDPAAPGAMASFDVGQVIYGGLVGIALLGLVAVLWRRAGRAARRVAAGTIAAILMLGGFAVLVDGVHALAGEVLDESLRLLEEGGELVAMTCLLVWVTWATLEDRREDAPPTPAPPTT